MSEDFTPPTRIVSILTSNVYNTVTSIDSIMGILRAHGAELPTRALLLCDKEESKKIQPDDVKGRIKDMGLEAEIGEIPEMNNILKEPFPYSPEDGDVINSRPGSGTHLGLMMESLTEYVRVRGRVQFWLADIRANGTEMDFSRVLLDREPGDSEIKSSHLKFPSRDSLSEILEDSQAGEKHSPQQKLVPRDVEDFIEFEQDAGIETQDKEYVRNNLLRASTKDVEGLAFEEIVGYAVERCPNIKEVFVDVKWFSGRKFKSGPKEGERMEFRQDDCLALTKEGNVLSFSAKFNARQNKSTKIKGNNKRVKDEIEKLRSFSLPGKYPRQRVFMILVTTTPELGEAKNLASDSDIRVTNLRGLCAAINDL